MNRNQLRKLHRWIFIFMGVVMLAWIISGIVMILPGHWFGMVTRYDHSDASYSDAALSPAEAISRVRQRTGSGEAVKQLSLRVIDGRLLYTVTFDNKDTRLVDAATAQPFEFTIELAEKLTRRNFNIDAPLLESTRLTTHDSSYPRGPLPAYRIRFDDNPGISYFLQTNSLRIYRSSLLTRIRSAVSSLHEFQPISYFTGNKELQHYTLLLASILSLVGALAGVILTLPRRNPAKR